MNGNVVIKPKIRTVVVTFQLRMLNHSNNTIRANWRKDA